MKKWQNYNQYVANLMEFPHEVSCFLDQIHALRVVQLLFPKDRGQKQKFDINLCVLSTTEEISLCTTAGLQLRNWAAG